MHVDRCRTHADYREFINGPRFAVRWKLEDFLAERLQRRRRFTLPGVCAVCDRAVDFTGDYTNAWQSPAGILVPNWREVLTCPLCGMNGRQRMLASVIARAVTAQSPERVSLYLMEVVSPVYQWLRRACPDVRLVASEYFGRDARPGESIDGIRHEDAERLSLADDSLDLVVSCDVFEHVNDPLQAFREVRRVLRPGGRALMTFPMDPNADTNRRRAFLEAGTLRMLEPAVYHGNPLSSRGSLVFTDFGWEVVEQLGACGFEDPAMNVYWSYELGYLGTQFFFDLTAGR